MDSEYIAETIFPLYICPKEHLQFVIYIHLLVIEQEMQIHRYNFKDFSFRS